MKKNALNNFAKLFYDTLTDDERIMFYKAVLSQFKPTDSGRYGKAFEINVKTYLNGNRGNSDKVSLKGKQDVKYHGYKLEIKSNCGEINDDIMKNDYIVYSMHNERDYIVPQEAKVMTPSEFINLFDSIGLIRDKKTTNGYKVQAIQSYKNSKKKSTMLAEALAKCMTLKEWKENH